MKNKKIKMGLRIIIAIVLLGIAGLVSYLLRDKNGLPIFALLVVTTLPFYLFVKYFLFINH